jgi:hypothetical protein
MHFIKNPIVILIALFLSGCGTNTTEPIQIEHDELLKISGALNKSFFTIDSEYDCQAVVKSWDIGNTLFVSFKVKNTSDGKNEQVSMHFYLPLGDDDSPQIGKYYSHNLSDNFSGISFKSFWNNNSVQYRFESGTIRILIENNTDGLISGKFSLTARQSYGQRIFDGQVEDIKLANDGKISVSGKIFVNLDVENL